MFSVFNRLPLFFREFVALYDDSPYDIFVVKLVYSVFFILFYLLTYSVFNYFGFNYFCFFYTFFFELCIFSLLSSYSIHALYIYLVDFTFPVRLRIANAVILLLFSLFFIYFFFDTLIMFFYLSYETGFFDHYSALLNGTN